MSRAISLQLRDDQVERLERAAERLGLTPEEAGALLLEESLRENEFPSIEIRDTIIGREAFLRNTRLKVWQVVSLVRSVDASAP